MGWLWSSGGNSQESKNSSPPDVPATQGTPSPSSTQTPPSPPNYEKPLSRDELAEAEFQALVSGLNQSNDNSTSRTSNRYSARSGSMIASSPQTQTALSTDSDSTPPSIDPRDLVPKEMSCRTAFDYAFFCQSFGGQWVNVYRYGELRDCSERWSDFWFCMRTMSYPTEQRERMIADYHRQKLDKYKGKPSSEDVWEMRTVPLRGAFEGDFLALEREMKVSEGKGIDSQGATR